MYGVGRFMKLATIKCVRKDVWNLFSKVVSRLSGVKLRIAIRMFKFEWSFGINKDCVLHKRELFNEKLVVFARDFVELFTVLHLKFTSSEIYCCHESQFTRYNSTNEKNWDSNYRQTEWRKQIRPPLVCNDALEGLSVVQNAPPCHDGTVLVDW